MTDPLARISIPLPTGAFEVSGSESFVAVQIEGFREVLIGLLANTPARLEAVHVRGQDGGSITAEAIKSPADSNRTADTEEYSEIYDLNGGNVRILLDKMPGASVKEQTVNAALLYLFGKYLNGTDGVSTGEIRDVCKHYGFLDGSNFMGYLKEAKRMLLIEGSARAYTVKLTGPGRAQAKVLAKQLTPE